MGVLLNLRRYQEKKAAKARKSENTEKSSDECMKIMREKVESSNEN
jgi:hypothetical protein